MMEKYFPYILSGAIIVTGWIMFIGLDDTVIDRGDSIEDSSWVEGGESTGEPAWGEQGAWGRRSAWGEQGAWGEDEEESWE
ncbi:MAG: hypothetical protein HN344_01485, partial [Gammaproteobacteria bacterium]|nr:hypothetical protein [Gammaproteobacteria bacterium]